MANKGRLLLLLQLLDNGMQNSQALSHKLKVVEEANKKQHVPSVLRV